MANASSKGTARDAGGEPDATTAEHAQRLFWLLPRFTRWIILRSNRGARPEPA